MATERIRVRVRTTDLLKKVQQAKAKTEREYKTALTRWERDQAAYQKRVVAALATALAAARKGKLPKTGYDDQLKVPMAVGPRKPSRPDLTRFDRDIALLTMSTDDETTITANDRFIKYL